MDFVSLNYLPDKKPTPELSAGFKVVRSKDLMVRGRTFYAVWDEDRQVWSTDEYDVQRLVDEALTRESERIEASEAVKVKVRYLRNFENSTWSLFRKFLNQVSDNSHQLDESLTWADTVTKKSDYVSRRLPYTMQEGDHSAWDELVSTLYSDEDRTKIEWAIGAIVSGDSKKIQKFIVLYGPGGTGKSTVMNIIQNLFEGYTTTFEAKALVGVNNSFGTEAFRSNPLVAIQHDGDLSKIDDNSKLNSIISHEEMTMNEKFKASYTGRINAFLFMGTNKPVKISDAKSGVIRRLIDVSPTGVKIPPDHYYALLARVEFELGAIAHHCLQVYRGMGKNYYNAYRPTGMMFQTDVFFNFVEAHFDIFKAQDGVSLKQAYALYKEYCEDTGIGFTLPQYKFREELKNYFREYKDRGVVDGQNVRGYFQGFTHNPFKAPVEGDTKAFSLVLDSEISLFNTEYAEQPAQLATADGLPKTTWSAVKTTLSEIDTREVHYVKVPENHIVIDFDLKGEDGTKSLERNLRAASEWPPTYAERSRSGEGIHLHYLYGGDASALSREYSDSVEIKVFTGNASLRRRLTKCNNVPIAPINSGLPLKEKKVQSVQTLHSEKGLRDLIGRNLRKEIHPGTKSSIDFIEKVLKDAYESGMAYDVTDMRSRIMAFANNSTNQPLLALKVVQKMHFKSEEPESKVVVKAADERLVFFDVEVYKNLFVVCWKFQGSPNVVRMVNPTAQEMEALFKFKLVGFNNRRYDNHILWARFLGYDNEQLYKLSVKIIEGISGALFGEAYDLSYADIYDFSSKKQGLKKFEIELGLLHMELDLPYDQPVDEKDWKRVVDYCCNDVVATEGVFEARLQDFVARKILAELSGLSPNDTTQKHTTRIVFGKDRSPQKSFVYTDLSKDFPGYTYERGVSTYREEVVGEGGYVYAEPGMYENVAVLDVASMHPTSIEQLNAFGPYTKNFAALKAARMAIKHKDFAAAERMLGGALKPFLGNPEEADALSYALKIVINIVYGLTSAKFENLFRDPRNKDNIVAKRGALFMIDLKHAVQEQGFTVAHIKTDSIKIPDATPEIIEFVTQYGKKYGYDFEHEITYDKFCLVNDAVYIARKGAKWTAVGAQFQHPYVYKTLFTNEEIVHSDLQEAKTVGKGTMYLNFEVEKPMALTEGKNHFVGRTGLFVPVVEGGNGGTLYRFSDGKFFAVTGTKNHLWIEASVAKDMDPALIDMSYFEGLALAAKNAIDYFGPFASFVE